MYEYTCPDCKAKMHSATKAEPGQQFQCPECQAIFAPRADIIGLADDPPAKPATARPAAAKPATAKPAAKPAVAQAARPAAAVAKPAAKPVAAAAPQPAAKKPSDDDDEDEAKSYGVVKESEEEELLAKKKRGREANIRDKFAKSARGPAAAMLVTPTNLLLAQGGILAIVGLACILIGMWPVLFTDGGISDEEVTESLGLVFIGIVALAWAVVTIIGGYHIANLGSYAWAITGAVFGLLPLLAGIFALTTLRDPRVIAGFEEPETGPAQAEDEDAKKKEEEENAEEDEDDEDEEEEEEEKPRKRSRK